MTTHVIIDCDAAPFVPQGFRIKEHRKGGQIEFDPAKVVFYLDEEGQQVPYSTIEGNELLKRLEGKPVMNACVLDYLLANTNLLPESWKQDERGRTRYIFFWGTFYLGLNHDLYVRCLYWEDGQWNWDSQRLDDSFGDQRPAALLAS
ncbi:hypothetical protein HY477_01755 [Candidatus Uhrbacteria bacterium]|nr:hypothetical protein [Candidatus Uhrbacteria bacterium]